MLECHLSVHWSFSYCFSNERKSSDEFDMLKGGDAIQRDQNRLGKKDMEHWCGPREGTQRR